MSGSIFGNTIFHSCLRSVPLRLRPLQNLSCQHKQLSREGAQCSRHVLDCGQALLRAQTASVVEAARASWTADTGSCRRGHRSSSVIAKRRGLKFPRFKPPPFRTLYCSKTLPLYFIF